MLDILTGRNRDLKRRVARVYVDVVDQARRPEFYTFCGVPDTVWGRFDMIVLHAFLVFRRLREGGGHEAFAQALFDHMFADMDYNLRELGVGDLSVGKKVKQMAQGFYGRATAYESGLAAGEEAELGDALRRNLYGGADPGPEQLALVGGYLRRDAEALRSWPIERLLAGEVRFGSPPGAEDQSS